MTIDAVDSEWPIGSDADDDAFIDLIEKAIRGMDTEYFDRLRQAIAARTLLLLLPEERRQRMAVLGTAGRLLLQAPGGEIDLGCGNAMHLFRSRA